MSVTTVSTTTPEIPLQVITPADVRASVRRARRSLEKAAEEIVWQIEMEAWRTLGYSSWRAMREAEYGGAAFMVPGKSRPEIVARMKEVEVGKTARGGSKHLTDQEIADTAGVSRRQVQDDLRDNNEVRSSAQNVESDDDVVDAEVACDNCGRFHDAGCAYCGLACGDCECNRPFSFLPAVDDADTSDVTDTPEPATDPAPTESVTTSTCPTCHGTGKVT